LIDTHDVDQIVEAEVLLADGRQAQAEDILSDAIQKSPEHYDEMTHDLSSDEKVETSANKPLEMDLTEISFDFEALPSLDASALQAAPIPDAFNGDFSNMLKIDAKPKSVKSATQASTQKSKSVNKTSKESKASHEESADVATKLELAAAYIDMEDKEGALALLAEAVKEGGPEQRARAQALIESLS
jgi:pilus assembly protein FimV